MKPGTCFEVKRADGVRTRFCWRDARGQRIETNLPADAAPRSSESPVRGGRQRWQGQGKPATRGNVYVGARLSGWSTEGNWSWTVTSICPKSFVMTARGYGDRRVVFGSKTAKNLVVLPRGSSSGSGSSRAPSSQPPLFGLKMR